MELKTIKVEYKVVDTISDFNQIIKTLPDLIACDFETQSKFSKEEKEVFKKELEENSNLDFETRRVYTQYIESNGLSFPTLTKITHLSIGISKDYAYVVVFSNKDLLKHVLNWLVTTTKKQVWHNALFDLKVVMFHTGKFPKNFEDTALLAKTLLNHVYVPKAKTGLKHLMGWAYGSWAVAKDQFELEDLYNEKFLLYAATDAAATYKLWYDIQDTLKEH